VHRTRQWVARLAKRPRITPEPPCGVRSAQPRVTVGGTWNSIALVRGLPPSLPSCSPLDLSAHKPQSKAQDCQPRSARHTRTADLLFPRCKDLMQMDPSKLFRRSELPAQIQPSLIRPLML
jgi:hypothetical protein